MTTYSSILAWGISWTEEPGEGPKELDVNECTQAHVCMRAHTHTHTHTHTLLVKEIVPSGGRNISHITLELFNFNVQKLSDIILSAVLDHRCVTKSLKELF